jgi:16S rRNA (guanine1207-N2)-methyltransferase
LPALRVFASDVFEAIGEERYDLIVSNPPFHRGKAVDYTVADRLIEEAPGHLAEGGSLLVVANAFLAYGKRMSKAFRDVETVVATRQFHVLRARGARAQS